MTVSYHSPLLINTIGHSVGVLLFGVMIVLLSKDLRHNGVRQTRLSLTAAALAFLWNLGSLLVLALSGDDPVLLEAVVTFSFSVLSLLPAVLLHLVLRKKRPALVAAGYAISGVAVALHFVELTVTPAQVHQIGLFAVSGGFGLLMVIATACELIDRQRKANAEIRLVSLGCLLLFTLSFIHFGYGHAASAWTSEIAWHHAGIPLALIVLLQDYRFLLLDVFCRFLLNFGLAALYGCAAFVINRRFRLWERARPDEFWIGIGFVVFCIVLISFASLRSLLQRWLTSRLFLRSGINICTIRIAAAGRMAQTEEQVLNECAAALAECVATERFLVQTKPLFVAAHPRVTGNKARDTAFDPSTYEDVTWVEAVVPLRFSRGDACNILLGARLGGRRYLSEDLALLGQLSTAIVEQIEKFRGDALQRLVSQAELKALHSQINPHFLFNALNTLYGTIDRRSQTARRFVLNLAEIFRYFLQTERTLIRLEEELEIVRAYLEIEQMRLGERLETCLSVPDDARRVLIPALSIQPLVENAVKHGIASKQRKGRVTLSVTETPGGWTVKIQDTGDGFTKANSPEAGNGIGLENVRQRLRLYYGEREGLNIASDADGTAVSFFVPTPKVSDDSNRIHRSLADSVHRQ